MTKKKKNDLEPDTALDEKADSDPLIIERLNEMTEKFNGFVQTVAKLDERTNMILQNIIRPPEVELGPNGEKKDMADPKSQGIGDVMSKKFGDASVGELVQAGDLMLRVNERRKGLTDLEEFMVTIGKSQIAGYGSATSHKLGAEKI